MKLEDLKDYKLVWSDEFDGDSLDMTKWNLSKTDKEKQDADGNTALVFKDEDKLLIETDAPYMTPVPFRGKRCDSLHIPYTAEKIAELRGCTAQEILDLTDRNARELFRIK